ncbi:MAG: hypothetical protein EA385_17285 [Salinarimonadaceae bacterium]|nr:MAG: hypothetical protein EA385_17285 [Salinarimonadaceae bacterium]
MSLRDWEWRRVFKPAVVTGRKQRKTLDEARQRGHEKAQTRFGRRRAEIQKLIKQTSRTGGALETWLALEMQKQGIVASTRTIRTDLKALRFQS